MPSASPQKLLSGECCPVIPTAQQGLWSHDSEPRKGLTTMLENESDVVEGALPRKET